MDSKNPSKLRPSQVFTEYGIPTQTQANWRSIGKGPPFIRLSSRCILYDRHDLERYFSEHKVVPARER